MHQNQSGMYTNQMSRHASLLLSASPTIVSSPLQNNTGNTQTPTQPATIALIRKQPSTPLLSASNLDNDSRSNTTSPTNNSLPEGYINFKKPQNEIFKKLDGKIQKIVAAHSNLNKLYALNDFSGSAGPRRPFELPAQLPPPPPWIPKVAVDYVGQWSADPLNPLRTSPDAPEVTKPGTSIGNATNSRNKNRGRVSAPIPSKSPNRTLDSAISMLHQRRQQQLQQFSKPRQSQGSKLTLGKQALTSSGSSVLTSLSSSKQTATITPAQFTLLTHKIRETLEKRGPSRKDRGQSLSDQDRKEFKDQLIALLKNEIAAVAKNANLSSSLIKSSPKPIPNNQRSLLTKTSPQTLFNTIRRETSILLSKRDRSGKPNHSIFNNDNFVTRPNNQISNSRPAVVKELHTVKVIVPPIDTHSNSRPSKNAQNKTKRANQHGLRFSNYLEIETPQQTTETMTVEQFARCLDLVRTNDASLKRQQEKLLHAETRCKMPISNRPLRLRRIRGERIHMPVSASYRATRKAGLQ